MKEYYEERVMQTNSLDVEAEMVEAIKQSVESMLKAFFAELNNASCRRVSLDVLPHNPLYLERSCEMKAIWDFFLRQEKDVRGFVYFSGNRNDLVPFIQSKKLEVKLFWFTYGLLATMGQNIPRIKYLIDLCLDCPPAGIREDQIKRIFTVLMVKHLRKSPKYGFAPYSKWLWEHHECLKPLEKIKIVTILIDSEHRDDRALKMTCQPSNTKMMWMFVQLLCLIFLLVNSMMVFSAFPGIGIFNLIISIILVVSSIQVYVGMKR